MAIRVTQTAAEVFAEGDAKLRVTQVAAEVFAAGDAKLRVTQLVAEVFVDVPADPPSIPNSTPNLRIRHVAFGQNQKDTRASQSLDDLDNASCGGKAITINSGTIEYTLSYKIADISESLRAVSIEISGTATGTVNVFFPEIPRAYIVRNLTSANMHIRTYPATGVTIAANKTQELYFDGTSIVALAAAV